MISLKIAHHIGKYLGFSNEDSVEVMRCLIKGSKNKCYNQSSIFIHQLNVNLFINKLYAMKKIEFNNLLPDDQSLKYTFPNALEIHPAP